MKLIFRVLEDSLKAATAKGFDHIVVAVDLHNTIIDSELFNSTEGDLTTKINTAIYTDCLRPLRIMSTLSTYKLMMFSGTEDSILREIIEILASHHRIKFDFINEYAGDNNTKSQSFSKKPYYSMILDDKAGFTEADWGMLENALIATL